MTSFVDSFSNLKMDSLVVVRIGGNWYNGVYDSTHIISSRRTTEFRDFLMPIEFGDFPSAKQMFSYFNMYADHYKLWDRKLLFVM